MSTLFVDTVEPEGVTTTLTLGASGDTVALGAGAVASGFGGGKVLQVLQATKTDSETTTTAGWDDVTG